MKNRIYKAVASALSVMAVGFVSVASLVFVYSPEVPSELKGKGE